MVCVWGLNPELPDAPLASSGYCDVRDRSSTSLRITWAASTPTVYPVEAPRRTSYLPKTQEVIAGRALATESRPWHLTTGAAQLLRFGPSGNHS